MDDALYITLLCLFVSFVYLCLHLLLYKNQSRHLPPGKTGWPVIGETWEFVQTGWKGQPEKFVMDRLAKYAAPVFKTNLVLEPMAVFCGAEGNKFLFANENKYVGGWYPTCVDRILLASTKTSMPQEMSELREALPKFLNPQSLASYVGIMDEIAQKNLTDECANKEQVLTYPLVKQFTFALACRLFLSIEDEEQIDELVKPFYTLVAGLFSIPINFPGSPMNKAIKASKHITRKIHEIMKQRKMDLAEGKVSPSQDILLHMLDAMMNDDDSRRLMKEDSIAAKIMGMLIAGHDTASIALTFIVKYLAEYPEIYDAVYKEQIEIANSKAPGELLTWKDLQQMKYSWNVACEALRLTPPSHGAFREALIDFTYKGFSIPKGWKLYWSVHSTHKNPEVFPNPEKFDPTRFEGSGPAPYTFVPFGGGKRICPGKEYARLEILVYMHNLVKRFKWEKIIPNEAVVVNPMPVPAKGLPIRLIPHEA